MSAASESLRLLFGRLLAFKVLTWSSSSSDRDTDRETVPLGEADVVASLLVETLPEARHVVAIDIDHQSWLVKSSTPGHYHLYIDVPGGIEHFAYMELLSALARAGVIEEDYANASRERGHSAVRLPWVKKKPLRPVGAQSQAQA